MLYGWYLARDMGLVVTVRKCNKWDSAGNRSLSCGIKGNTMISWNDTNFETEARHEKSEMITIVEQLNSL